MNIKALLMRTRSYRRFDESRLLDEPTLKELVDVARYCPSAGNRQPLKYMISASEEKNGKIFPYLRWAAALPEWPGPAAGERPTGYIVILGDIGLAARFGHDAGIVAQGMMMAAMEKGIAGCMMGSIDQEGLRQAMQLPKHLEVILVLALGYPNETVVLEDGTPPDKRPYWRDAEGTHHVPKRSLEEVLVDW
ncbi:MAG: nitroreductase family protein [Rhodopirellula sp.]|nr:nitroreductase family protein [Rhodopirellula sp.]